MLSLSSTQIVPETVPSAIQMILLNIEIVLNTSRSSFLLHPLPFRVQDELVLTIVCHDNEPNRLAV